MRPKLALKTLYRSPVRTILTFILLAAVTFALFSQVLEYSIADREMKKAVEQYDGALAIQSARAANSDASNPQYMYADTRVSVENLPTFYAEGFRHLKTIPISDYMMEQIAALPYISYIDTRYMTAGYSDVYTRVDDGRDYYNYANQCVVEATIAYKTYERITVQDVELLGGKPKRWFDEEGTFIWAENTDMLEWMLEQSAMGEYMALKTIVRNQGGILPEYEDFLEDYENKIIIYDAHGVERATTVITAKSKYGPDFFETLEIGKRYIFVLRHENYQINMTDTESYYLTDPFVNEYCEAVIPVDGLPENYLETEEFAGVRGYIDRVNRNMHTFDMVYTQNTNGIRYFAEGTIGISEGRGIKQEDTENKNNVCVIHHDMAQEHGLKVGDTLTVKLGDKLFEQYASKGAIDVSPAQAPEKLTEVTLEIVGIFKDTRSDDVLTTDPCWSYSVNTIFVPQHLLSVSEAELENHKFAPAEVSFVIDNAWDIPAFIEECIPQIKAMKISPFFSDGGWANLIEGYRENERLSLIKLGVLAASVFVSTCFVAFLYIVAKRQDYAIMRVLGTSKKKAGSTLLLPLFVMSLAAVFSGCAAAVIYTQNNITTSDSIEFLSTITQVDTGIPPLAVIGCFVGEIALTLFIAEVLLLMIGRNSPLALIQAQTQRQNRQKARKKKKKTETAAESTEPVVLGQWVPLEKARHDGKKRKIHFTSKYILRHIRRTKGKAVMLVLVTALLLSVAGQLLVMDVSYNKLFEETEIVSNYAGYLNLKYVNELMNSGYVRDVFYKDTTLSEVNGMRVESTVVTSDIERFAGEPVEIEWLEGYNGESMRQLDESIIVLGGEIMLELGVELGDTVYVARTNYYIGKTKYSEIYYDYYNMHVREAGPPPPEVFEGEKNPEYTAWMDTFNEKYLDIITEEYHKIADAFKVVGCVDVESRKYAHSIFLNGNVDKMNIIYGKLAVLDVIEATLIDNWKAEEYREYGEKLASANLTGEVAFVMDTSKLDNVRNNIKLMDTLFPIIITAILVIGAFLCGLLIAQTSKDIAIMRVLGTSKRRVRLIMIIEHTVLCTVGMILSAALLALRQVSQEVIKEMLYVCAMYLGAVLVSSIVAAVAASRKNVLELLQTKE